MNMDKQNAKQHDLLAPIKSNRYKLKTNKKY